MTEAEDRGGGIQVIARAATILRLLGDHTNGLSLAAIAGRVGLPRSTVQRIVQALETEGLVELAGPSGGFRLGPSLAQLLYQRQMDIVGEVRPILEALCLEMDETVALCALSGARVTTMDRCVAERPLRVVFPLGTIPEPIHRLAPGRAILAELTPDRAMALLREHMSEAEAKRELASIAAERDRARDTVAYIADLAGFAVPLRTHLGLCALSAILPVSRAQGREADVFSSLLSARARIEARIGVAGRR